MPNYSENKRLAKIPVAYRSAVEKDLLDIAAKIKKRREAKNISQEKLAEMLQVDPTTIQGIEQLRVRPSLELLLAIVKILEMKITLK